MECLCRCTELFYRALPRSPGIFPLPRLMFERIRRAYETVYNTIRPHQALGQRTPAQFYQSWLKKQAERG